MYKYYYLYKMKKKKLNNIVYIVEWIIYMIVERYLFYCSYVNSFYILSIVSRF